MSISCCFLSLNGSSGWQKVCGYVGAVLGYGYVLLVDSCVSVGEERRELVKTGSAQDLFYATGRASLLALVGNLTW